MTPKKLRITRYRGYCWWNIICQMHKTLVPSIFTLFPLNKEPNNFFARWLVGKLCDGGFVVSRDTFGWEMVRLHVGVYAWAAIGVGGVAYRVFALCQVVDMAEFVRRSIRCQTTLCFASEARKKKLAKWLGDAWSARWWLLWTPLSGDSARTPFSHLCLTRD